MLPHLYCGKNIGVTDRNDDQSYKKGTKVVIRVYYKSGWGYVTSESWINTLILLQMKS